MQRGGGQRRGCSQTVVGVLGVGGRGRMVFVLTSTVLALLNAPMG